MKEQNHPKRRKLFLILAIIFLLDALIAFTERKYFGSLIGVILSILFFVLWITKPVTSKENAHVTVQPMHVNAPNKDKINSKSSKTSIITNTPKIPYKTEKFHVTGTSHYQKEIESLGSENYDFELSKKELIEQGFEDEKIYLYEFSPTKVELIEEPDNPHDPNAIKVVIDDVLVGYIKKGSCSHIKKLLHSGKIKKIDADIYGGKYKMLYSEYDDEKDKEVYYIEKDKSNYYVSIEISIEE